jgi:NAD(P)-dependent dehydrogenase (short-subunit alcohol dehydrogenase family)
VDTIALVTGANKGLGLETVKQLAAKGMTVLLGSRSLDRGQAAAASLVEAGLNVEAVQLDVTSDRDIQSLRNLIEERYGKLDVLVNNAGILQGETLGANSVLTVSAEDVKSTFDTNFFGALRLSQVLMPLLQKSPAARIVNVSSILSSLTLHASPGSVVGHSKPLGYNASKAALNMLTLHLADALRETNIKVNSAHPGWVKTELGGANAPMRPESGVRTIVQLATLPDVGPSGKLIHVNREIPW